MSAKKGHIEGIKNLVKTLRELDVDERKIRQKIKVRYNLTDSEADKYLKYLIKLGLKKAKVAK